MGIARRKRGQLQVHHLVITITAPSSTEHGEEGPLLQNKDIPSCEYAHKRMNLQVF